MTTPEFKQAVELIRRTIGPGIEQQINEICVELVGRPQAEIDAELVRFHSEVSRLMKQLNPEFSDALALAIPKVCMDMARERMAAMPSAGKA